MKLRSFLLAQIILLMLLFFISCSDSDDDGIPTPPPSSSELILNFSEKSLAKGDAFTLIVSLKDAPSQAIDVKWSSSNSSIVSVDNNGVISGLNVGTAIVAAMLSDSSKTTYCTVKVLQPSQYSYKFRLQLKNKGKSDFSVSNPDKYLSAKAIDRRSKHNIAINETDLPISPEYITKIEELGGIVVSKSKWLNTVVVHCAEEFMAKEYEKLDFVDKVTVSWRGNRGATRSYESEKNSKLVFDNSFIAPFSNDAYYGSGAVNININNGQPLHEAGYKGHGMTIGVIDGGFDNLDNIPFVKENVKGYKSFIYGKEDVLSNSTDHGLLVLSCMSANKANVFVGTAPDADYWLFRTEDMDSEYPIEEDYWVAAIEYADSVGVDVINTSVGYASFNAPAISYTNADTDGKTALITRAADMAVDKGMFVVCSAGNTGSWVSPPGDGHYVLAVGGLQPNSQIYPGSSYGQTADDRIKPDVVALGNPASCIDMSGTAISTTGTSLSSPIMCGLVACLWQAYPTLTSKELLQVIKESADKYSAPAARFGYGKPDMEKAMELAHKKVNGL